MTALETTGGQRGVYFTADRLMSTHFPEPRWAVPGLIAEGLTILGGAPKLGKSWLCLSLGVDVAGGHPALGKIPAEQGDVLYCALEDPPRRLKSRLQKVLGSAPAPERLAIVTELPGMTAGLDLIAEWLQAHQDARLVIIDVLAKIRPPAQAGTSAYEADYQVLSRLKALADTYKVAVVVVTHLRKMAADDVFDQVSGSTGLTGAADATLVLKRSRGEHSASLHVTGREIVESEYAITFDADDCTWRLDGDALAEAAHRAATQRAADGLGDKAAEVIAYVTEHPEGVGPTAVGAAVGLTAQNAGTYLQRLDESGRIAKVSRGRYAPVESVESVENEGGAVETEEVDHAGFSTLSTHSTLLYTPLEGGEPS